MAKKTETNKESETKPTTSNVEKANEVTNTHNESATIQSTEKTNAKSREHITITLDAKLANGIFKIFVVVCLTILTWSSVTTRTMVDSLGAMLYSVYFVSSGTTNTTTDTTSTTIESAPTLYSMDYFKANSVTVTSNEDIWNLDDGGYYVYFYQTTCGYCTMTAPYIEQYINDGKTNTVPIYFVNVGSSSYSWIWSNEDDYPDHPTVADFRVVGTPTMIYIDANKTATEVVGPQYISNMLGYVFQE